MSKENFTKEELVNKGVSYIMEKRETLFLVSSLKKKYPKVSISDSNIIEIDKDGKKLDYVTATNVKLKTEE